MEVSRRKDWIGEVFLEEDCPLPVLADGFWTVLELPGYLTFLYRTVSPQRDNPEEPESDAQFKVGPYRNWAAFGSQCLLSNVHLDCNCNSWDATAWHRLLWVQYDHHCRSFSPPSGLLPDDHVRPTPNGSLWSLNGPEESPIRTESIDSGTESRAEVAKKGWNNSFRISHWAIT